MTNDEILDLVLNMKHDDITSTYLKDLFADKLKTKAKVKPNTHFTLPANKYHNKTSIDTTVGRFIYNKLVLEPDDLIDKLGGYQNMVLSEDGISSIESKLTELLMEDKIEVSAFEGYVNRVFWLGFNSSCYLNPSLSMEILKPLPKVEKRKKELREQYKEELADNDIFTMSKIEKELLDIAKEELKDTDSYQIYASGAKGSFSNNYKNNSVCRGGIRSTANPDEYHICFDNLVEGISKENFPYFADITVAGTLGRAVETRSSGYETKKCMNAFQTIVLDDKDTDCKSKGTLDIVLTKENYKLFIYRYIVEKDKLVLLGNENIKSYIGKMVHLRSPLYCCGYPKICNKCAGERNYILEMPNIGLQSTILTGNLSQKLMKKFHDLSLKVKTLSFFDYLK